MFDKTPRFIELHAVCGLQPIPLRGRQSLDNTHPSKESSKRVSLAAEPAGCKRMQGQQRSAPVRRKVYTVSLTLKHLRVRNDNRFRKGIVMNATRTINIVQRNEGHVALSLRFFRAPALPC